MSCCGYNSFSLYQIDMKSFMQYNKTVRKRKEGFFITWSFNFIDLILVKGKMHIFYQVWTFEHSPYEGALTGLP